MRVPILLVALALLGAAALVAAETKAAAEVDANCEHYPRDYEFALDHPCHRRHWRRHNGLEHSREAITVDSKAPKSSLQKVHVIHPKRHRPRHWKKWEGEFKHRPLLDNGREFLHRHIPRRWKHDECTGCPVPFHTDPRKDPRNRLDKKGRVIGKKKVLPVVPELRERRHRHRFHHKRHHKKGLSGAHKKRHHKHHRRPHFYPLTRKQLRHVPHKEHYRKVLRRLPKHPHYHHAKKPARLYNPKEGWPCDGCLKKGEVARSPLSHRKLADIHG